MNIKLVIFDFDGVFTNGTIHFIKNNIQTKYTVEYNVKDGMAIKLLKNNNIKSGCISSFSFNKRICFKEQIEGSTCIQEIESRKLIFEHLNFNYYSIGKSNKLEILKLWMRELNIGFNEIAYIGDDISDIEILKLVKFSACPNDAIDECKRVVNYICNKKGGEGCVREFVDIIINNNYKKNIIQEIRSELNYQIDNFNINKIYQLSDIIQKCEGIIYFMGIGKSGNIAKHCCTLLKSISINCFYLETNNALHGDIGTINKKDIIIMFSKSGNTKELIEIIPYLKKKKCQIIGLCCNIKSKFNKSCDLIIEIPLKDELSGKINKIPTNSCVSQLLFSNILVSILKNNISLEKYRENHPAGNIGYKLQKIKDIIITEYPKLLFKKSLNTYDILFEMTKYKIGCCFFVDENNKLLGILTDGDIRRLLLKNNNSITIKKENIATNYYYETDIDKYIYQIENIQGCYIPIIKNTKIIGIISI